MAHQAVGVGQAMAEHEVDLASWPRAGQFHLFRSYQSPHFALTSRIDVTAMTRQARAQGFSTYRACLFAIGAGVSAVPEMRTRIRGNKVVLHEKVDLSMTVPRGDGTFGYAYVPFEAEFARFDASCADIIARTAAGANLAANTGQRDDLIYLSCLPWIDFTSLNNAMPGPGDCIPRLSWGKFVDHGERRDMAVAVEVHHALVDGAHLGAFLGVLQDTLDAL